MSASLEPRISNFEPDQLATPPCPHFGPCGGCQLQHLTYAAQLASKAERLHALLDASFLPLPELQLHPSPPLAYRNRIRLTLSAIDGHLRAGYLTSAQPGSNSQPTFLPVTQCPIAAPILWNTTQALLAEINHRAQLWIERAPFTFDQLELFTTANESAVQISLFVRTSAKSLPAKFTAELDALCQAVSLHIPELTGAGIYLLPTRSVRGRRSEVPHPGPAWGTPGLTYTVPLANDVVILSDANNPRIPPSSQPGSQPATDNPQPATSYWVPRSAFFQVNRFLLPELVSLVTNNQTGTLAWDLYAGVGLFTRALAPHFAHITAVEAAEPAFTALASTRLPNRHAVKDTTLEFLQANVIQRDRPDLIILDPPRTGAGPEVCELLGRVAAPTLIYVSCSPETLPADLETLLGYDYSITQLHLFDLFPQTTHIETVAILTR